jgi:hypothetical protein
MPKGIYKRTQEMKKAISLGNIGRTAWNKGKHHSSFSRLKISQKMTGRKLSIETKEKMKKPKSLETKEKIKAFWKNKNNPVIIERNKKISEKMVNNKNGCCPRTLETRKRISLSHIGIPSKRKGCQLSEKTKMLMRQNNNSWNRGLTKETDSRVKQQSIKITGIYPSDTTREKLRNSAFEYVKIYRYLLYPCLGHDEKHILDELESFFSYTIIRQYKCLGYFIDGYIPELKIAIEVDERKKNKPSDIKRQILLQNKLGCSFLRIPVYNIV